ncbi:MFS transporter [Streptomyces sp. SAJ15]|nr:MFS transporter [Streptomyces sp. SAJ15]
MTPAVARRRFAVVTFLYWLPVGLYLPAQVLLLTERGVGLTSIAGFYAVYSLTVACLELPTGGLSDVIGRRAVLVAAGLLSLVGLTLLALGTTAGVLLSAMVLLGAGRALSSGPAEAWYVDTVQAHSGPDAELRTGIARGSTATATALAVGTLLGGGLPWLLGLGPDLGGRLSAHTDGLVLPLSVPVLLGVAVVLGHVTYVLAALTEPPRAPASPRGVLRGVPATMLDGVRLGARDALVRRVLLSAGAVGAALSVVELLTPRRAAVLTGGAESGAVLFAALACAGFLCTALGGNGAPLAARLARGGERAVLLSLGLAGAGALLLAATATARGPLALTLAALGYGLVYLGLGAAGPNQNEALHRRVGTTVRATALSVQSLALQLAGALATLAAGVLPPGAAPWLLAAVALLAGAALWARPAVPAPLDVPAPRSAAAEPAAPVRAADGAGTGR